jgi:hypothetical protein
MIEMILLAILIAKLRNYRLSPLVKEWVIYPVLVSAVLYIILQVSWFQGNYNIVKYSKILQILLFSSLGLLIIKYRLYKAGFVGIAFLSVGGILNGIVMKANGGKMPVYPTLSYITGYLKPDSFDKAAMYDKVHFIGGPTTKLSYLADRIDIGYCVLSFGDIFFYMMMFIIIYKTIVHLNSSTSNSINTVQE